ncbi:MAG: FAD-dependent oxidoreductase [Bacteroidota bacterium]
MMRRTFLKMCTALGLTVPTGILKAASEREHAPGSVLVIGAGAAGLLSGYVLHQLGIDYQILEASSAHGGRMKRTNAFTDFPISLGAEWLTTSPAIFETIVRDPAVQVDVELVSYDPKASYGFWQDGRLTLGELGAFEYQVFQETSWFDVFDRYIVPTVAPRIRFDSVVETITYGGDEVVAQVRGGQRYTADRVVVTVPLAVLQAGDLTFSPQLPRAKQRAIESAKVWGGLKVFIEFTEAFYPTFLEFDIQPAESGQKLYYDAAYGKSTRAHVLGFFAVGAPADPYLARTGDALREYMLAELDEVFSGQASRSYVQHVAQNWSREPYIKGAYVHDGEDGRRIRTLSEPVANKIYFAGDAYTSGQDWGAVHTAAQSALTAVDALVDA